MTQPAPRSGTLHAIQLLRCIAACAVVVYHASLIGADYMGVRVLGPLTDPGKFGVNLFFVLSGFIICFAHARDVDRPDRLGRYAWRRVTRIYPAYWLFTLAYVAAAMAGIGSPDFAWSPLNLLSIAALIKLTDPVSLPLQVAWTLFYEMQFYLLFSAFLINRSFGLVLFGLWTLYILIAFATGHSDPLNLWAPWNLHFLLGCGLYLVFRKVPLVFGPPLLLLGAAGIVLASRATDFALTPLEGGNARVMLLLVVAMGAIVLGSLALEARLSGLGGSVLMFLGDASYSIYLVHSGIISALFILARKLKLLALLPPVGWFAVAAIAGIAGGAIAFLLIERPLLDLVRKRGKPRPMIAREAAR